MIIIVEEKDNIDLTRIKYSKAQLEGMLGNTTNKTIVKLLPFFSFPYFNEKGRVNV